MNKLIIGILVGLFAGILDIIPMMFQKLTWDANISAFSMWVIVMVQKDSREPIDIKKLNAEIKEIVAWQNELRKAIDEIVEELDS